MKKKITVAASGVALLIGAAALTGCASSSGTDTATIADNCTPIVEGVETVTAGVLTAAVAEYPPYISQAGDEITGPDGALLQRVANELCLELNLETQASTAIYENVRNGAADLTSGNHYLSKERLNLYGVSTPVYRDEMVIISKDGVSSIEEMEGLKVGTTQGYLWVGDFQEALGSENVQLYATEDATYQDVANGRIAAGIVTDGGARQILAANNDTNLKPVLFESTELISASVDAPQSVVLVTPGNTALLEAVDLVLEQMREDGTLVEALESTGFRASAADTDPSARDRAV